MNETIKQWTIVQFAQRSFIDFELYMSNYKTFTLK